MPGQCGHHLTTGPAGPSRAAAGFTLIEILVVVAIIGIMVSMATLSVSRQPDGVLEEEGRRITALIKLASEESILNASDMAMELYKNGYRFSLLEADGSLTPVDAEEAPVYRPRELPEGVVLEAEINGEPVELALEYDERPPAVFILSSGELTPFVLDVVMEFEDMRHQLAGDFAGEVAYLGRVQ